MTRYFFHVREGENLIQDDVGVELASELAAHEEASMAAREILAEKVMQGDHIDGQVFVVSDKDGICLFELPFKGVLNID